MVSVPPLLSQVLLYFCTNVYLCTSVLFGALALVPLLLYIPLVPRGILGAILYFVFGTCISLSFFVYFVLLAAVRYYR